MKKYLSIVCTGNNTTHNFSEKNKRIFDVCIIYYGDGKEDVFETQSEYYFKRKSPKYKLIREILPLIPFDEYLYIFIPDDDLIISIEDINELFLTVDKNNIELAQPSIDLPNLNYKELQDILDLHRYADYDKKYLKKDYIVEPVLNNDLYELRKKYVDKSTLINRIIYGCSYPDLLRVHDKKDKIIRAVSFIEVQCPILSIKFLKKIYHILTDPIVVTGFGIDRIWSQSNIVKNKYVIDFISAIHRDETHYRQLDEVKKGKRKEEDVAEQYRGLKTHPMDEADILTKKYSIDKLLIVDQAIEFYIDRTGFQLIKEYQGYETRNSSICNLIKKSHKYIIEKLKNDECIKGIVYTGDRCKYDIGHTCFSMAGEEVDKDHIVPSFVFDSWKQVGIDDYEEKIQSIINTNPNELKKDWIDTRVFWIGNCNSNFERWKYIDYTKSHPDTTLFKHIVWNSGEEDMSKSTNEFVSLEDHSKYRVLLDGVANGYSGRLPFLLSTGRPVIIHKRRWEQWFFYDGTFIPWEHYIPLDKIEDLEKIVRWTIDNKDKCIEIGKNGQKYVHTYLTMEKVLKRYANTLLNFKTKKGVYDNVYNQITKDNNYKYTNNTMDLLDIAHKSTFKLMHHLIKIKIINNKMFIESRVKAYERRELGLLKIVELCLKNKKVRDGTIYINVSDEYIYAYPNLPILILAKPKDKNGILFVDQSWVDVEPESDPNIGSKFISWTKNKDTIDEHCSTLDLKNKENKIFFIGQNIDLKKTTFNIRKYLSINNDKFNKLYDIPLKILMADEHGYIPMYQFCKYKYLLNLPGMSPWSFRFKNLFLMKSFIINIALIRKYGSSFDEKWINIFDPLFVDGEDYVELKYEYDEKDNVDEKMNELVNDISILYKNFEPDTEFYNKITNSGYNKAKNIDMDTIGDIAHKIIDGYTSSIANVKKNDFFYSKLNYEMIINNEVPNITSKLVGRGIQGIIYMIMDKKNGYKWIIKITDLHIQKYDSFRELYFSEILNEYALNNKITYNGFLQYYGSQTINNKSYLSMEHAGGDLITWLTYNNNVEQWKNMITQILLGIINLQKLNIIHNDLQPKNILFNKRDTKINYRLNYKSKILKKELSVKYLFYIGDFGISACPSLEINLLNKTQMNIKNYDLKKFSSTCNKFKALSISKKYSLNEILEKFKLTTISTWSTKLQKLQKKTSGWKIDEQYKKSYIHLHIAYYYVKKGLFNETIDYADNFYKIPTEIENIFNVLKEWKNDIDEFIIEILKK